LRAQAAEKRATFLGPLGTEHPDRTGSLTCSRMALAETNAKVLGRSGLRRRSNHAQRCPTPNHDVGLSNAKTRPPPIRLKLGGKQGQVYVKDISKFRNNPLDGTGAISPNAAQRQRQSHVTAAQRQNLLAEALARHCWPGSAGRATGLL
jgi:hypothetical protein